MRKVKPKGIQVSPSSAPNFSSSRRHFISAATLLDPWQWWRPPGHWGDTTRTIINSDLPQSDLYVSFGHRPLINGLLIPACDLVNESSITRSRATSADVIFAVKPVGEPDAGNRHVQFVETAACCASNACQYLHIRLDDHDVILANGVPAETL